MRVCPNCGYHESPIWKNTRNRLWSEYCHISELESFEPKLAIELREKHFLCINGVKYRLNRSGTHVHRIAAYMCAYPSEKDQRIVEPHKEKHLSKFLRRQDQRLDEHIPQKEGKTISAESEK